MSRFNIVIDTPLASSSRVRQLEGMFDVPRQDRCHLEFSGDIDLDSEPWNVGLIVGPSGSGKSTIARELFAEAYTRELEWKAGSVIDDFSNALSMEDVASACQSVGFNTIPAWMRPYHVLSTGEKFRVEVARCLLEFPDPIVIDEFTSVVDRQVAQIGSHAVQKFVRKHNRKFVAVSCHHDIVDWLQPDWIFEPAYSRFTRRRLRRRPELQGTIRRVTYDAWKLFAPYHYLTAELNKAASRSCFGLFIGDRITSFAGMLTRPTPKCDVIGCSRLVTLPDYQGLGLAMILIEWLGEFYRDLKKRVHAYPAHPALIRAFDKSPHWALVKKPGVFSSRQGISHSTTGHMGGRPCAVFEYVGNVEKPLLPANGN